MQEIQNYIPQSEASVKSDLALKDIGRILKRRRILVWSTMLICVGLLTAMSLNPSHRWWSDAQLVLLQQEPSAAVVSQQTYEDPTVDEIGTPYDMIQSNQEAQRAYNWLKNLYIARGKNPAKTPVNAANILSHVRFNTVKGANTIDLSAYGPTAQDANDIANAIVQSFVAWNREVAQRNVVYAIQSLTPKVDSARDAMVAAQDRLKQFEQSHRLADVPTQEKDAIAELASREATLAQAKQSAESQDARLAGLASQLKAANISIKNGTGVRDDTEVQSLQSQLIGLEMERQKEGLKYTPNYPGVLPDLDKQIADVRNRLSQAVKATLNNKMPSLQNQDTLIQTYQQQQVEDRFSHAALAAAQQLRDQEKAVTEGFPSVETDYDRLNLDASNRTAQYNALVSALDQALVDKNTINGDVVMTDEVVNDPFNQIYYTELFVLGGILIGLIIVSLSVLGLEQIDTRLYSVEEVRRLIPGPIVGALPVMSFKERRAIRRHQVPAIVMEAFHIVRANLSLVVRRIAHREIWQQVVLVASAVPGEGKSMTASLLARSLVQAGKRVVLVDGNLRRPVLQNYFHTDNQPGLASVLTEQATVDEALSPTEIPGLMIMHSGMSHNHPTDLLTLPVMQKVIQTLRSKADAVIIDTPPCSLATDALFLAAHADCVVQVVGVGVADEMTLSDVTEALQAAAPKAVTYFLNFVPREKKRVGKYYLYSLSMARNSYHMNGLNGTNGTNGTNGAGKLVSPDDGVNIVLSSGAKSAHKQPSSQAIAQAGENGAPHDTQDSEAQA